VQTLFAVHSAPARPARLASIDILRGVAVLAMVVVHFHQRVATDTASAERVIGWFVAIGLEQKSWGTFAFLFGAGFALLLKRSESAGASFASEYLRRLLVLALIGLAAEALLGFHVLIEYALWGLPLLLIRRLPTAALLAIAACAVALMPLVSLSTGFAPGRLPGVNAEADLPLRAAVEAAEGGDSYGAVIASRLRLMRFKYTHADVLVPGVTLALFILGLLAVRSGALEAPLRHKGVILGAMIGGLFAGMQQGPWLCLTYIGGALLLLGTRHTWLGRLNWLTFAGRMPLTNCVLQIALLEVLVTRYGLALRLRPALALAGAMGVFGGQVVLSRAWLSRYPTGPCEWLWRAAADAISASAGAVRLPWRR
jgi:uncharacterized protein